MNCFSTKNEQDIFLQTLIDKSDIKQRRPRKENATQRQNAFQFYVLKQTDKLKVCKKAFISLYGITEARVRRLCDLLNEGKSPIDKRGCHPKANTVPPEICQKIHEHILCFPRKKTHYAGKDIDYLDARLDVKKMHSMFNEQYPDLDVKYKFYLQYFNENFSLRFGRPQVDTCITCEELSTKIKQSNLSENAKRSVVAQLMIHKRRAKKFYNKISSVQDLCKERDDVAVITFDFMQNLPLPHIPIQNIFYLRQLWVHCFGIKDLKTGKSTFYMYHEGIANKGANEVCSMLMHYMKNNIGPNIKYLYLFSDGCPGQNKNNTMLRFMLALTDSKRFEKVYQYFPTRGHSFLPNDRDFGVIKKNVRKHDRIYVPGEYIDLVSNSSSTFTVVELKTEDVLEFKKWWPNLYKKTCLSTESYGKKVPKDQKKSFAPSTYMSFQYDSDRKGTIIAEEYIDGLIKHSFSLIKKITTSISLPSTKAYDLKVPINKKK